MAHFSVFKVCARCHVAILHNICNFYKSKTLHHHHYPDLPNDEKDSERLRNQVKKSACVKPGSKHVFHFNFLLFSLCLSKLYSAWGCRCSTILHLVQNGFLLILPTEWEETSETLNSLHDLSGHQDSSPISFGKHLILPAFIDLLHLWPPAVWTISAPCFNLYPWVAFCFLYARLLSITTLLVPKTQTPYYFIILKMSCSFSEHEVGLNYMLVHRFIFLP